MASIGEASKAYLPPTTNNITDLEIVDINWDLKSETFKAKKKNKETGEEYEEEVNIEVVELAGIKYRVPTIVKKQLKAQLKANPDLKYFKVTKEGTGLATQYTVIPLITKPEQNTPIPTKEKAPSQEKENKVVEEIISEGK